VNALAILSGMAPNGVPLVSIMTGRTYSVTHGGKCEPVPASYQIVTEPAYYQHIDYEGHYRPSLLNRDIDVFSWRNFTDLVVQGVARTDKPVTSLSITLVCRGKHVDIAKEIIATGDRWVERGRTGPALTEPVPFFEMPVRYDKAYGGTDEKAEAKLADREELQVIRNYVDPGEFMEISEYSYPRNPPGKGYLVHDDGLIDLPWPNLEFPNDRLTLASVTAPLEAWGNRPYPACFDWFGHAWFPRVAFFGEFAPTADDRMPQAEVDLGILPSNLNDLPLLRRPKHGFAQGAHPYLCRNRLHGDEKITVTHMSGDGRDFLISLPREKPHVSFRDHAKREHSLDCSLDLVFVETEKDQVTLLWRATLLLDKGTKLPMKWQEQCEARVVWR
jgi:hypothetical protein